MTLSTESLCQEEHSLQINQQWHCRVLNITKTKVQSKDKRLKRHDIVIFRPLLAIWIGTECVILLYKLQMTQQRVTFHCGSIFKKPERDYFQIVLFLQREGLYEDTSHNGEIHPATQTLIFLLKASKHTNKCLNKQMSAVSHEFNEELLL